MIRLILAPFLAISDWFNRGLARCLELPTPGCDACAEIACLCDKCWRDGRRNQFIKLLGRE